jgi:ReqiPepy6 Gp37-like protein
VSVFTTLRFADNLGTHLVECATYGTPITDENQATVPLDVVFNCTPGGIGVLETTLPTSFNTTFLMKDGRIGVWRAINGRPPYLDNNAMFLIRYIDYGPTSTFIRAYHTTSLLDRRIIAYAAGSSFAQKAATFADDQIKAFVNENMGASISGANRDGVETQADVSTYLTVQANTSQGASVAKAAARRTLLTVAQELAEASNTAGTYLTFEILAPSESTLELRTYATQRGIDHRVGSTTGTQIILSELRGNLKNAHLIFDYTNEVTFAVAGGQGEGTLRLIATTADTVRMGESPFGRIERFYDMSNVPDATSLQDDADAGVRNGRPVILFTGDLTETFSETRGITYDLGDMLTAEHPRTQQQFDVRLDVIHETISSEGRRTQCGLRSVT